MMVRIVSGIVAVGWGWKHWKKLQSNPTFGRDFSDAQIREAILAQHVHWLQWLDRVMDRVNETQPPGDEVLVHYNFPLFFFCPINF